MGDARAHLRRVYAPHGVPRAWTQEWTSVHGRQVFSTKASTPSKHAKDAARSEAPSHMALLVCFSVCGARLGPCPCASVRYPLGALPGGFVI